MDMITYVLDLLHNFITRLSDEEDFEEHFHAIIQRYTTPILEAFYIEMQRSGRAQVAIEYLNDLCDEIFQYDGAYFFENVPDNLLVFVGQQTLSVKFHLQCEAAQFLNTAFSCGRRFPQELCSVMERFKPTEENLEFCYMFLVDLLKQFGVDKGIGLIQKLSDIHNANGNAYARLILQYLDDEDIQNAMNTFQHSMGCS